MPDLNAASPQYRSTGEMRIAANCSGCSVCLAACPLAKNFRCSSTEMFQSHCISCGACMAACPENTVGYQDDTERFLQDLQNGLPISLLAAPAVRHQFNDYTRLFGFLKHVGVRSIHSVLLHADITLWAYVELLRQRPADGFIASPCAAVSAYIRQHLPLLVKHLIPVHSPLLCTAIYLKQYKRAQERLAFLSPCIAKRSEMRTVNQPLVSYNVTIGKLKQYLHKQKINLNDYTSVDFDDAAEGCGKTLESYGGVSESLMPHLPDGLFVKVAGTDKAYDYLAAYALAAKKGEKLPTFVEIYNCPNGCNEGTGTGVFTTTAPGITPSIVRPIPKNQVEEQRKKKAAQALFQHFRHTLFLSDFLRNDGEMFNEIREVATLKDTIYIKDNETILDITYQDMIKYHGRSYIAGVAMAFKLLQRSLAELVHEEIASRDDISILLGVNGPGIIDGLEMATRAKSHGQLVVNQLAAQDKDAPDAADGKGGKYYFEITHGDKRISLALKHGLIPPEFIALSYRAHADLLTPDESLRLQQLKEEIASFLTAADAMDLFTVLTMADVG